VNALRTLAAAALLVPGACTSTGAPRPAPPSGRFELVSMDGQGLPAPSRRETGYTVHDGWLVLGPADSASLSISVLRRGAAGMLLRTVQGRYRVAGDSVVVALPDAEMRGRVAGATLTLRTTDGSEAVFRRP
jgi:hypothetical protein